ncbi:MAG: tetratricopeptide repeat protein [Roseibacillus sp.]
MPSSSPNRTTPLLSLLLALALALPCPAQEKPAPEKPAQEKPAPEDSALEQYFVANGAYNRKLYPIAIQQFVAFLEAHAEHPKADLARRGLALSHYASKQYKEAIPPLAALLAKEKLGPTINRERLVMMHGQCLLITGEKDKARELYVAELAGLKTAAYQIAALVSICDVSFGNSKWDEVVPWSEKLLAAMPGPAQTARGLYQQGYAHYQLKDPEKAIVALKKIEALKADKVWITRAVYLVGECYNQLKRYGEAEVSFAGALPGLKGADAIECRYRLGLTRFVLKKHEESATDLTAYLAAAAEGAHANEAKLYLARTHLERGAFKIAGSQLKELSAGTSGVAARANLWLARVYTRSEEKDYTAAAVVLAEATETFVESAVINDLRFDYANALMARAEPDWTTALATFQLVEESGTFGQMAEILNQRAVCLQKLENYQESLASNEKFLTDHPKHPLAGEARFMRAENLFLLGKLDQAAEGYGEFLTAHAEHPNRVAALFRQAQIHHAAGRWAECLTSAAPLLANKPAGPLFAQLPFMIGDSLFRQKKWSAAIDPLKEFLAPRVTTDNTEGRVVKADPNVDTALIQLAVSYDRTDQKEKALDQLLTVVNHYPGTTAQLPLALAEQGRLAYERGNLKLARTALEKFVLSDTEENEIFAKHGRAQRPRVQYYLGWIEATEKQHSAAASRFSEVVNFDGGHPLAPDAALQQGIALFNGGQFGEAATHFEGVLKRYPEHAKLARVVFHSGLALARQKEWPKASAQFQRITKEFPKSDFADQALYEQAWCERALKRMEEATKLYEQLLADHPQSPLTVKVHSELAELNVDSGAQDKIIAQLTVTLEKVKDAALREEIRYQLASAHFKKGDHANSAKLFATLLEDYPTSKLLASMHFQAGESQLQLKQAAAARDHFAAAATIAGSPQSLVESITMRLGETQAHTGQHEEAATTFSTFLDKFPESRWTRNARFGFAFATENAGNPTAALPEYAKLLAGTTLDLWTVRSRFQSGACHFKLKHYDQAVIEFVKVEISYPQYPSWQAQAILEIGRLLLAQEKPEQAAERFQDVIRRFEKEGAAAQARKLLAPAPAPANN